MIDPAKCYSRPCCCGLCGRPDFHRPGDEDVNRWPVPPWEDADYLRASPPAQEERLRWAVRELGRAAADGDVIPNFTAIWVELRDPLEDVLASAAEMARVARAVRP